MPVTRSQIKKDHAAVTPTAGRRQALSKLRGLLRAPSSDSDSDSSQSTVIGPSRKSARRIPAITTMHVDSSSPPSDIENDSSPSVTSESESGTNSESGSSDSESGITEPFKTNPERGCGCMWLDDHLRAARPPSIDIIVDLVNDHWRLIVFSLLLGKLGNIMRTMRNFVCLMSHFSDASAMAAGSLKGIKAALPDIQSLHDFAKVLKEKAKVYSVNPKLSDVDLVMFAHDYPVNHLGNHPIFTRDALTMFRGVRSVEGLKDSENLYMKTLALMYGLPGVTVYRGNEVIPCPRKNENRWPPIAPEDPTLREYFFWILAISGGTYDSNVDGHIRWGSVKFEDLWDLPHQDW